MKRLALFGVLLASATACTQSDSAHGAGAGSDPKVAPSPAATRVEAATVNLSQVELSLVRPGEVEAAREVAVAASLGGLVEQMDVDVGDMVEEGQLIAKVDAKMHRAQQALARVEVDDAKRELARLESMGKAIPRVRVDEAKTRLARAQANLRIAQIRSERAMIRAPFAGTIAELALERGEVAPPGAPLVRLIDVRTAVISVAVSDRDVGTLEVGAMARVSTGAGGSALEGKIARVDPTANLKTRAFKVEVEVPNEAGGLKPGMIATVDFRQSGADEQVVIPQEFLVTRRDGNGVFVVGENNTAKWRPLELGAVIRDQLVVTGGLAAGENVVTLGQRSLSEGDVLLIARQGVCCTEGRIVFSAANAVAHKGEAE